MSRFLFDGSEFVKTTLIFNCDLHHFSIGSKVQLLSFTYWNSIWFNDWIVLSLETWDFQAPFVFRMKTISWGTPYSFHHWSVSWPLLRSLGTSTGSGEQHLLLSCTLHSLSANDAPSQEQWTYFNQFMKKAIIVPEQLRCCQLLYWNMHY